MATSLEIDRKAFVKQMTLHEGRKARVYRDSVGKLTIGIGHNLDDKPISDRAIDVIFEDDVFEHEAELVQAFPWVLELDGVRQAVLLDMAFNLGIPRLKKFKTTLDRVKSGDYDGASRSMLQSRWASQVKGRAVRLAEMMRTGNSPFSHE